MNHLGEIEPSNDEAMLVFEVSDQAVEDAAGSLSWRTGAFTLAMCSGIDTCPSLPA